MFCKIFAQLQAKSAAGYWTIMARLVDAFHMANNQRFIFSGNLQAKSKAKKRAEDSFRPASYFGRRLSFFAFYSAFWFNNGCNSQVVVCAFLQVRRYNATWQFQVADVQNGAHFGVSQINFDELRQLMWEADNVQLGQVMNNFTALNFHTF